MTIAIQTHSRQQLVAAVIAFGLAGLMAALGPSLLGRIILRSKVNLLTGSSKQKDLGEILQRDAFADDRVLPVYGSSELTKETRNRADEFFKRAPTGFRVCPVGREGIRCLLIAERFAALGPAIRGRKLAVFVSSTWFLHKEIWAAEYHGNFSKLQCMGAVLDESLAPELRSRLAKRMNDYPGTFEGDSVLAACVRDVAGGKEHEGWARARRLQLRWERACYAWSDGWNTAMTAIKVGQDGPTALEKPKVIDWTSLYIHETVDEPGDVASETLSSPAKSAATEAGSRIFLQRMESSSEWADLDLMLDILVDLHARPLILGLPLPKQLRVTAYPETKDGLTREAREYYYQRLEAACFRRGLPLVDWKEHDGDDAIGMTTSAHFTRLGWVHVDRVLDDFYHDRLCVGSGK